MRKLLVIALALGGLGALTCLAEAPAGKAASRPQWEYKTVAADGLVELGKNEQGGLDKLGDDGWELVAVTPAQSFSKAVYYFKRPKTGDKRPAAPAPEAAGEQTQLVRLKYALAPELAQTLQSVFGGRGGPAIVPEPRSNTLIVRGSEKQVEEVHRLIRELDIEGEAKKPRPAP
jgi:hypothetical protein